MAIKTIQGDKVVCMHARIRYVRGTIRLALIAFCSSIGFVVVATAVPQRREVLRLEQHLKKAEAQEKRIDAVKNQRVIELRALREDPLYLEMHARDRLDVCKDGEMVFRFPKE